MNNELRFTIGEVMALLEALSLLEAVESFAANSNELLSFCSVAIEHAASAKRKLEAEYARLDA